jgi:H+/Cl- antiporter ClcA
MTDSNAARQAAGDRGEEAARTGAGRGPNDGSAPLAVLRLFLVVAVLGLVAAFAAVVFEIVVHLAQNLLWSELPSAAGWQEPPWWYVLAMPALGGLLVALALRLPGHGGHPPLEGLGTNPMAPLTLLSVLLAALATLSFGIVLGPEAPLMAIGLTCGLVVARAVKAGPEETQVISLAGAFAVISTLFGGPLPSSLMLFEMMAARGVIPSAKLGRILVPGLVAAGSGTLLFTGVADWPGVGSFSFSLPPLPDYPTVRIVDLVWCLLVAVVSGLAVILSWRFALIVADAAKRHQSAILVGVGLLVGLLAVVFRAITDQPVDLVLFSGQSALPELIALSSAGVLVLLMVEKALAYGLSLGSGFRGGGPIFPATFLGTGVGVLASLVLPGLELTPAVITGLAAGTAAVLRAPFFGALLAALLGGPAAAETIPLAILGAVIGWLTTLVFNPAEASETKGEEA